MKDYPVIKSVFDTTSSGSHSFTIQEPGTYMIKCWGAEGGGRGVANAGLGGKGGYACGVVKLKKGEVLNIHVGGMGKYNTNGLAGGGYNGGGNGYGSSPSEPGNGGGGASDVRVAGNSIYNRIIVAGGGGGGGEDSGDTGGAGGGLSGTAGNSGAAPGTQTSGNAFGNGGSTNRGDGGGGGGGWYGGGAIVQSTTGIDSNGGSGGSGYVLTSKSSIPSGYFSDFKNYLCIDSELLDGNSDNGRFNNGKVSIYLVETLNMSHYSFKDSKGKFFIPNEHFYYEDEDFIEDISKSDMLELDRYFYKFVLSINDLLSLKDKNGVHFYKRFLNNGGSIVRVSGFSNMIKQNRYNADITKIDIKYNINPKGLQDTKIITKDDITCKKTVGNYHVIGTNKKVKVSLNSDNLFYGENFKVININETLTNGFTYYSIKNEYIDIEKFKILIQPSDIFNSDSDNVKSVKVILKKEEMLRMLEESEYDIITDSKIKKSYIRFNSDYDNILFNKTYTTKHTRVNTLDKF